MLTEGRVRAIAAQVASAIMSKIKPSVSEEQIRSDVEAVVRQMKENGELTGSDLTDEQIVAVQENAEAALSAKSAAESARDQANQSATNAANSAGTASTAAANASSAKTAAQTAQGKAEAAQAAAESAKATTTQQATEATNAAQTAAGKATEASESATAAGTAKTAAEEAAARAEAAADRLLGVAVVGVIETVNGAPSLVLTGVQEVADYTAYYKVVDEEGNETLVEIGQLVPKDETEPEPTTYTVTFVADGVTVDAVEYQEGDTALERVPDVPAKEGYTGVWEAYDITNGGNITVNAVYTQIPVTPTYTNLFTAGTAKLNTRIAGTGELKTDANATGKVTTDFITIPSDKLPFEATTKIYIKGATFTADGNTKIATYQAETGTNYSAMYSSLNGSNITTVDEGNGVISVSGIGNSFPTSVKRMALTLKVKDTAITADDVAGIVITIGEPIS